MKKYLKLAKKFKFVFFAACLAVILFIPQAVGAQAGQKNVYIPEGLVYNDVFFASGVNINLNAQMKDDVYLVGASVIINGPVEGDVIAVGSNLVINSEIKGNLRAVGGNIVIKGRVEKNVTIVGGMITLEKTAEIGKNLFLAGGNVEVNSKINKNIYAAAGNIILNSEVAGSAYLTIDPEGSLVLYPQTNIHGNLEYTAKNVADKKSGATISNDEKFSQWRDRVKPAINLRHKLTSIMILTWLVGLLGCLVVGLVLVTVKKDFVLKVQKQIDKNIPFALLSGLAYIIIIPIALLILAITIIGLPLAVILGSLYFILIYVAKIFIGVYLGEKVLKLINKKAEAPLFWSMVVGVILIYLACLIPYLGFLVKLVVGIWGVGVIAGVIKKDLKLENS